MRHRAFEDDDGNTVDELDGEAIDYMIVGLRKLRDSEPGIVLSTPVIVGDFEAMAERRLVRLEDADPA